jgi:hypothetical protein
MYKQMDDIYKSTTQVTFPSDEVVSISKTIIVDSRQRNCRRYKTPSHYKLELGDIFKNISSIELKGAIIPKSSYNVHSSNNKIDFAIGDYISSFKILNGGGGYTSAPTVSISRPSDPPGVNATATAIINNYGSVTNIIIDSPGSGYSPSKPPTISLSPPDVKKQAVYPNIISIVGNHYTAVLREGEYEIGGNPTPPSMLPTKLLLEIQNSMNYAVNGGNYDTTSSNPFVVRLVSQYPTLDATPGTPEAANTNSCNFNRIQMVNVNSDTWEILWCTGTYNTESSAGILGFNTVDTGPAIQVQEVTAAGGPLIPTGTAIRGFFDYSLLNDPDYVVLTIGTGERNLDRITSLDDGMDHRFCTLLFDNNNPDTMHDLTGITTENIDGIDQLIGNTKRGEFFRFPGGPKPMKGSDFDGAKKISFKPPIGKLSSLSISFTKYGYRPGSAPKYYNMEGREHLLLFEVTATDQRSRMVE